MRTKLTATALVLCGTLSAQERGNLLIIVADDLGKEVLSIYDTPTKLKAATPNIERLAERGVVFDNVWGYPLSAPVRAAMLTGRNGHDTGIVSLSISLPLSERTIFESLPSDYSNALFGKWHLSRGDDFAESYGIDYFAGFAEGGGVRNYNGWRFTKNGKSNFTNEYVTTTITNEAKGWIEEQESPWFCWVAYNAPHTPYHLPPSEMHTHNELSGSADDIANNPLPYYLAMVESLDYEIGRLLESVDSSTTVIFVGDNGTERGVLQPPYSPRHGKGTLYESGVAIPMVVCDKSTRQGERSDAMVSAADIYPTAMEFMGCEMSSYEDGYSFAQVVLNGGTTERQFNFSEILNRRLGYTNAISDGDYKLISTESGQEELYNVANDPYEQQNLLLSKLSSASSAALKSLRTALKEMEITLDNISETTTSTRPNNARTNNARPNRPMNRPMMQ
ncbi:MAG: sulfatase-like hydrolase/transferase [Rikenellaceae bacterium]